MRFLVFAVMFTWSALLHAADLSGPHILVAKPELRDELFGATILVVRPLGGDQHLGFIVNRPTGVTLGKAFPEHGPSQKVGDPVSESDHARFVAGLVIWRAGELRSQIERGAWYVLEPDAALAMRKPNGLWEELVRRISSRNTLAHRAQTRRRLRP